MVKKRGVSLLWDPKLFQWTYIIVFEFIPSDYDLSDVDNTKLDSFGDQEHLPKWSLRLNE